MKSFISGVGAYGWDGVVSYLARLVGRNKLLEGWFHVGILGPLRAVGDGLVVEDEAGWCSVSSRLCFV